MAGMSRQCVVCSLRATLEIVQKVQLENIVLKQWRAGISSKRCTISYVGSEAHPDKLTGLKTGLTVGQSIQVSRPVMQQQAFETHPTHRKFPHGHCWAIPPPYSQRIVESGTGSSHSQSSYDGPSWRVCHVNVLFAACAPLWK